MLKRRADYVGNPLQGLPSFSYDCVTLIRGLYNIAGALYKMTDIRPNLYEHKNVETFIGFMLIC